MGDYAVIADVQSHLGDRTIGASGIVTTTQVDAWIDQAEREVIGTISAVGGSNDYTADTAHATPIIRHWVATYVSGLARRAYAASAGDGSNEDGNDEIEGWRELLRTIRSDPSFYIQMLANAASSNSNRLLGGSDGTNTDGAKFKMTEVF